MAEDLLKEHSNTLEMNAYKPNVLYAMQFNSTLIYFLSAYLIEITHSFFFNLPLPPKAKELHLRYKSFRRQNLSHEEIENVDMFLMSL